MKILIAVHHFPPKFAAGAELRAFRTAKWMIRKGYDVRVVCVEDILRGPENGLYWEDDEYRGVPVRRLSFDINKAPDRFLWEYDNSWIGEYLTNYFSEFQPDIFHLISGYIIGSAALKSARKLNIPTVITTTEFWFICPRLSLLRPDDQLSDPFRFDALACTRCKYEEKRRYRIPAKVFPWAAEWFWSVIQKPNIGERLGYRAIENKFIQRDHTLMQELSHASAVVCPSKFLMEVLKARGVNPEKMYFNSHGIDTSSWLPVKNTRKTNNVFCIGYLGQISKHKGVHTLIRAITNIKERNDLELRLYGNELAFPSYTTALRKMIANDQRIQFLGKYPYENIACILSDIDVLVIPSLWNEIGPWVMYEAFETKTPVIASDIPNMSYVMKHGENGLLFEPGNSGDLTDQINQIMEDQDLYTRLVDGIRPPKKIDDEMKGLEIIYREVIAKEIVTT